MDKQQLEFYMLLTLIKWTSFLKITVDMTKKNNIKKSLQQTFNILRQTLLISDISLQIFNICIIEFDLIQQLVQPVIMLNRQVLHKQKQIFVRRTKKTILFKHQNNQIQPYEKYTSPEYSYVKIFRSKSPSKKSRQTRSLSKKQRRSKDSKFSNNDRKMTKQLSKQKQQRVNRIEYTMNRDDRINNQIIKHYDQLKNQNIHQIHHFNDKKQIAQVTGKIINASSKSRNKMFKIQRKISEQKYMNLIKNKQLQQLQTLREQNQYVKIVYKSSVQKMKRLQEHLQNQKHQYQNQRRKYQNQINQLKKKVKSQKKVNLGHIYSYDDKSLLEVKANNIIIETDREDSSYMQQSRKKENPSKLSLHSKMYQN